MNAEGVAEFQKKPNLDQIIQVRYLDEAGKDADMQTPPFALFSPMVLRVMDAHRGAQVP